MSIDTQSMAAQAGSDGGVFKFIGGLVLGFVLRSVGGYFLDSQPAGETKKGSAARSRKPAASSPAAAQRPREECKMVLCVNTSLGMGKGKIGAQCAHAAVGVIGMYKSSNAELFRQWERHGQPKIALKIKDDQEMAELAKQALARGLPAYIVHDAGRTQIAAGSQTVLAIGPGPKSVVDQVTGRLSLL